MVYSVKDNGVGIDMKYSSKLFGVFQRLFNSEQFDGTGVGVAIFQQIVSQCGGRVWAEGKIGQCATSYLGIPALVVPPQIIGYRLRIDESSEKS